MLHSGKLLECALCSATFNSQETLDIHNRLHAKRSFMCVHCRAVFSSMNSMKAHLWKTHSISKSNQERSVVTANSSAQSFAPAVVPDEKCFYKCIRCNKKFKYKFSIVRHLQLHRKRGELVTGENTEFRTEKICASKPLNSAQRKSISISLSKNKDPAAVNCSKVEHCNVSGLSPTLINDTKHSNTITSVFSVENQGMVTKTTKLDRSKQFKGKPYRGQMNPYPRTKYECGWCGASFRFDFTYEAHMKQHAMMDDT